MGRSLMVSKSKQRLWQKNIFTVYFVCEKLKQNYLFVSWNCCCQNTLLWCCFHLKTYYSLGVIVICHGRPTNTGYFFRVLISLLVVIFLAARWSQGQQHFFLNKKAHDLQLIFYSRIGSTVSISLTCAEMEQ